MQRWRLQVRLGEAESAAAAHKARHDLRLAEARAAATLGMARATRRIWQAAARRRWRRWANQCRGHAQLVQSRKMLTRAALAESDHAGRLRSAAAARLAAALAGATRQRAATRLRAWASAAARERERGLRRELGASAHLLSEYRRAGGASTLLRRLARWARGMALPRAW